MFVQNVLKQKREFKSKPEPDHSQRQREEAQLKEGLKGMSLRERTTFLRQVERDRLAAEAAGAQAGNDNNSDRIGDDSDVDGDEDPIPCSNNEEIAMEG
eukprot:gene9622-10606_t